MFKLQATAIGAGMLLSGCNGAFWGNLLVLGITIGIFVGTLSLGRSPDARPADSTHSRS
jgi:hypothetical protein